MKIEKKSLQFSFWHPLLLVCLILNNIIFSADSINASEFYSDSIQTSVNPEEYINLVDGSVSLATPGLYSNGKNYSYSDNIIYSESLYSGANQSKLSRTDNIVYTKHLKDTFMTNKSNYIYINSALDNTIATTTNVTLNTSNFNSVTIRELTKLYGVSAGSVINTDKVVSLSNVHIDDIKKFKNLQAVEKTSGNVTNDLATYFYDPTKIKVMLGFSINESSSLSSFTNLKIFGGVIGTIDTRLSLDKIYFDSLSMMINGLSNLSTKHLFINYAIIHMDVTLSSVQNLWVHTSTSREVRIQQLKFPNLKRFYLSGSDEASTITSPIDLSFLSSSSNLRDLYVRSNRYTRYSLSNKRPDTSDFKITNLPTLNNLENFVFYNSGVCTVTSGDGIGSGVYNPKIEDISTIISSPNLKVLATNAIATNMNNLTGVGTKIEELILVGNKAGSNSIDITDMTNLSKLTNLKTLCIPNTKITDWPNLNKLTKLEYLDITSNNISTLNIPNLLNLKTLIVNQTNITNYSNIPLKNSGPLYVDFANPVNVSSLPNHYTWYTDVAGNVNASTTSTYSVLTGYPNRAIIDESTIKVKRSTQDITSAMMGETGLTVEYTLKSSKYPNGQGQAQGSSTVELLVNGTTYKTTKSKGVGNTVVFTLDNDFWSRATYGANKLTIKYSGGDTVQGITLTQSQGTVNLNVSKGQLDFTPVIYDKIFDNTTDAIVEDIKFSGLLPSDTLELGIDYNIVSANYDNANVGNNKDVTVQLELLNTTVANKYQLTNSKKIVKGNILPSDSIITNVKIKNNSGKETTNFQYDETMVIEATVRINTSTYSTNTNRLALMYGDEEIVTSNLGVQLNKPAVLKLNLNDSSLKAGNIDNLKLVYKGSNNLNSSAYKLPTINLKGIDIKGTINSSVEYNGTDTFEVQINNFSYKDKEESVNNITGNVTVKLENSSVGIYDTFEVLSYELIGDGSHKYILNSNDLSGNINITKKELSINSVSIEDKTYDGNNIATINNILFNGLVNSEQLVKGIDYTADATFDNENVGIDKSVSVNVTLLSTNIANNYLLTNNSFQTTGNITKGASTIDNIKITNGQDEETTVFSFKDNLKVTGTPKVSRLSTQNNQIELLLNDEVIDTKTATENTEFQFDVTLNDLDIEKGTYELKLRYSGNYNLSSTEVSLDDITINPIGVKATIDETFTYNGNNLFTVNLNNIKGKDNPSVIQGLTGTAVVNIASKNIGNYTAFTVESVNLIGDKAGHYNILNNEDLTGNITINPQEITVKSINVPDKIYDETTKVDSINISFNNLIKDETLIQNTDYRVVANFNDKNVGTNKQVSITLELLDTENANNYLLPINQHTSTGNIIKGESVIDNIKITNSKDEETRLFFLTDILKVTATPKLSPNITRSNSIEEIELLLDNQVIDKNPVTENNQIVFSVNLKDLNKDKGRYKLSLKYTGNDNLNPTSTDLGEILLDDNYLNEDNIIKNPDGSITIPSIPVTAHPSPDGDKPVIEGKEPQKYIKILKHGRLEFDDLLVIFPDGGKFYQDGTYKSEDRTLNITTQQAIQSLPADQAILPTLNGNKPNYEPADNPYINLPHGADISGIAITDPSEEGFIIWLQDKETYIKCPTPNKPKVQIIEKGNIRIIIPDNSTIVRPDGSETLLPDGGHIDMPEGNPETNNPGGDINKNPDGTIIVPPGITLPPSSEVEIDKDGNIVVTLPPDSSITLPDNNNTKFPDGGTIIIKPNKPDKGDAEIELPNDKPVELPNGDKITDGGTIIIDPPNVIYPNKPDGNNNANTGGSGAPVGEPEPKPENPDNKPENPEINPDNPENSTNSSPGDLGDHWSDEIVNDLLQKGILNGYPDGTFHPDDIIKRSDASIMVYNMLKYLKINLSTNLNSNIFEDVNEGDYYYNYVNNMAHNKIVNGYNNGLFLPNNNITREESLVIIHNLSTNGYINLPNKTPKNISDLDQVSSWALDAVNYSLNKGLINGDDKGKLNPKNYITRAEFATIIYNLIQ